MASLIFSQPVSGTGNSTLGAGLGAVSEDIPTSVSVQHWNLSVPCVRVLWGPLGSLLVMPSESEKKK